MDTIAQVATWLNWFSLAGLGCYALAWEIQHYNDVAHIVICAYLMVFGIVGCLFEFKMEFVTKKFLFLTQRRGKGFFFIFVGTLGLSYGCHVEPPQKIIPFVVGCISCACGIVVASSAICKKHGLSGTYMQGQDHHGLPVPLNDENTPFIDSVRTMETET